ncbi:YbhB/YbcL family Raf kinase inhibitor-like protein [Xanthobacter versatilis]|uniref:YbhB/YbcL family Raf kinase inhibitor-like protein n=1 Tax=Xanthobacter autotrophicus (strain ATCC BAA-1158 / Py2) TaxID=78245 RepID=UPI00372CB37F
MRLTSPAFIDGSPLPRSFTCDGKDISPPLAWTGAPSNTKSYVVLCEDPDAPSGIWHHWAAYDIAPQVTALEADAAGHAEQLGFRHGINDFSRIGYGGAFPPHGHKAHRYRFHALAVDVEHLPVLQGASCTEVERVARKHLLAEALVVGLYER